MPSSKNFITISIIEILNESIIEIRIFTLVVKAEIKKQKNKGLVNKVSFEFDDHLILWFMYEETEFFGNVVTKLSLS